MLENHVKCTYLNNLNTLVDEHQLAKINKMRDKVHSANVIEAEIKHHLILNGFLFDVQEVTL